MSAVLVPVALAAVAALAAGAAVAVLVLRRTGPRPSPDADLRAGFDAALAELRRQAAGDRDDAIRSALETATRLQEQHLAQLADASRRDLATHTDRSRQDLDAERDLIGAELSHVQQTLRDGMGEVSQLLGQLRQTTERSAGEVKQQILSHAELTRSLASTADGLRQALANTNARGQWGERMAEDVLRHAGMIEGSNYRKQTKAGDDSGIPDFTFLLPHDQVLYMDVKFPLAAYMRWLDAPEGERDRHRDEFVRDVRNRVTELARREYGRTQASAVDHVLLFVPNESVAAFVHEHDPELVDRALRHKIILCSPLNLIALLGVIRQAVDAFAMEQRADRILEAMGAFDQQWGRYVDATDKVGRGIQSVAKSFEELTGTRRRGLERALRKVEALRTERGLGVDGELLGDAEIVELPGPRRELA